MANPVAALFLKTVSRLVETIRLCRYRLRMRRLLDGGLVIGRNVTIQDSAEIDDVYPYLIRIGDNCSISNRVRILAHDATPFKFTGGHTRLGRVEIRDNCFIGERAIILPGVTIGPNALVAAGSLVNRDIPPNSCAAGAPARVYARFSDMVERHLQHIAAGAVFDYADVVGDRDGRVRKSVWEAVQHSEAYVKGYIGRYPYTLNSESSGS